MREHVSQKMIEELEILVQLNLTESEREQAEIDLSEILEYARVIQELEPAGEEVLNSPAVLREDRVEEGLTRESLFGNAPEERDGYFHVPRTIGTEKRHEE
ncbi:Asp-tRNA(Asn)/Glu-tRNA(Gln) amidotransferase subunit GatC [Hominifimenecus sp. rT4P-3]|uniref:Asp-tRNA(Asn)/Glu-tRNA(Gln) amidotransferase subunit GatC n=1 Tax=Hominifimenecus sp. rT4P-3 TaxID=3242979 RepID=UPI003DA59704